MKLYVFRAVRLSIIRSLFTVHSAMVYGIQVCRQISSRTGSCSKAVYKPVWHKPLLSVQWINSWWWTDELSETSRVSWQNKFVKLVHLVCFIIKKFATMHGHTNVKFFLTIFFSLQSKYVHFPRRPVSDTLNRCSAFMLKECIYVCTPKRPYN